MYKLKNMFGNHWHLFVIYFLLIVCICLHISSCVITDTTIVIGFIGVLASIIVIGNVAQVHEIKHTHTKIKSRKLTIKLEN